MDIKRGLLGIMWMSSNIVTAGIMGSATQDFHPLIELLGGYASINASGQIQRSQGLGADLFTNTNSASGKNSGFVGVFLGIEQELPWLANHDFFMQTGIEYDYFSQISIQGSHTLNLDPKTPIIYYDKHALQSQQILGSLKLFATTFKRLHPYGELGLGFALNQAKSQGATTVEIKNFQVTSTLGNQSQSGFGYNLGLGVDLQVNSNIRMGLGYRYSHFGSFSLGHGTVTINQDPSPLSLALGEVNTFANQLIARISYVI